MVSVEDAIQQSASPRRLAQAVLSEYFSDKEVSFPINPFQMLTDYGVPFVFREFTSKFMEGVYLPTQSEDDIAIVGINIKRPITRQRYTAAHELCHHIKDSKSSQLCELNSESPVERFAEKFAAELLMPYNEMRAQIQQYAPTGYLSLDDILIISEYFGVSFTSCINRVVYDFKKFNPDGRALSKIVSKYGVEKRREERGLTHVLLYAQTINAGDKCLMLSPGEYAKALFCNSYVYNDSRLENVDIEKTKVAEIVTDIRLHGQESRYCNENHENEIAVAGHSIMYEYLFSLPSQSKIDVFSSLIPLHRQLYSCAPDKSFGGMIRNANPMVVGAKFETVDCSQIFPELIKLNSDIENIINRSGDIPISEYVESIVQIHHRLTIIHPFGDGNGRTSRAFLNLMLLKRGLPPVYIKAEDKDQYVGGLELADKEGNYSKLCTVFYRSLLQSQAELTYVPLL